MAKNLKSPNRYGGVTKLSNASRRRRPYAVRITTGYVINEKTGKATQKYAIIGYAKTRNEKEWKKHITSFICVLVAC